MNKEFFDGFRLGGYQRENLDSFLESLHFSYKTPSIHIAGTNGKGSTSSYIASVYSANGYKVGLFKSPFLFIPNEMISINGTNISDDDFMTIFNRYKKQIDKYDLSAFEIQTFVALTYFDEQKCDIAIIECGMGGEVDATNVFDPILSIITTISLEHTEYLGCSISEIAEQKGGIIKEEVPVLIGDSLTEDALTVLAKIAKDNNSRICYMSHYVNKEYSDSGFTFDYNDFYGAHIQSRADSSVTDACMALEAVCILRDKYPIDVEKAKEGLASVYMECRMDIIKDNPLVIIDGAHNPEAMKMLCEKSLGLVTQGRPIHVVFACFRDKNLGNMLSSLGAITDDLTITTFDNPRARTEDEYFLFAQDYPFNGNAEELIQSKITEFPEDAILITGSLAFAAYAKKLFLEGKIK
ncbi:MAG: bifunctional folylpolyglutamate synthase/dihydrofolate synthase [Bacilli bacterium]|nr:bifunctional folylpolyglutamate synthase/dihydrofolate synthase [Bacilli bacterium]